VEGVRNNLLVVSSNFENHLNVLREIAVHIKRAGLIINIGKSHFCMRRVRYLGHIICNGGIRTDPEKVKAITEFPVPKNPARFEEFYGLMWLVPQIRSEFCINRFSFN